MRASHLAFAALAALGIGVAFLAGQLVGRHEGKRVCVVATTNLASQDSAVAFMFAGKTLESIRAGKVSDAEVLLVRFAKLQTQTLSNCAASPECAAWVGKLLPSSSALTEVDAMAESTPVGR